MRTTLRWNKSISIHALREEGDQSAEPSYRFPCYFYPRPPRGGRHLRVDDEQVHDTFLSTPSARRATQRRRAARRARQISIHALREEGDPCGWTSTPTHSYFYPRPPRGGRPVGGHRDGGLLRFLSTPSARRATSSMWTNCTPRLISIHALREEGDGLRGCRSAGLRNFYPRPPRGGRLAGIVHLRVLNRFLSTPSARRATLAELQNIMMRAISIHALREEGDPSTSKQKSTPI